MARTESTEPCSPERRRVCAWGSSSRTAGLAASDSAAESARRPSSRWKLADDCARERAVTHTRTATTIRSCSSRSCVARVCRRRTSRANRDDLLSRSACSFPEDTSQTLAFSSMPGKRSFVSTMSTNQFAFPMVTPVTKCVSMKPVQTSVPADKDEAMSTSKRLSRHIALLGACAMTLVLSTGCTPVESFFAGGRAG